MRWGYRLPYLSVYVIAPEVKTTVKPVSRPFKVIPIPKFIAIISLKFIPRSVEDTNSYHTDKSFPMFLG